MIDVRVADLEDLLAELVNRSAQLGSRLVRRLVLIGNTTISFSGSRTNSNSPICPFLAVAEPWSRKALSENSSDSVSGAIFEGYQIQGAGRRRSVFQPARASRRSHSYCPSPRFALRRLVAGEAAESAP